MRDPVDGQRWWHWESRWWELVRFYMYLEGQVDTLSKRKKSQRSLQIFDLIFEREPASQQDGKDWGKSICQGDRWIYTFEIHRHRWPNDIIYSTSYCLRQPPRESPVIPPLGIHALERPSSLSVDWNQWRPSRKQRVAQVRGCHFQDRGVRRLWLPLWLFLAFSSRLLTLREAESQTAKLSCDGSYGV